MKVDPNQTGGGFPSVGTKIAMACGFHRWVAQSGNPVISVAFVVVDGPDTGCTFTERFTITIKAVWRLGAWAKATGYAEPFDSDDDDAISKVCAMGAVVAELVEDTYNGKTKIVPSNSRPFVRFTGEQKSDWDAIVQRAESEYTERMAKYANQRSGNSNSNSNSGSTGGYGGSNGGGRPAASSRGSDEDIPF